MMEKYNAEHIKIGCIRMATLLGSLEYIVFESGLQLQLWSQCYNFGVFVRNCKIYGLWQSIVNL